jgi:hypothetical protein
MLNDIDLAEALVGDVLPPETKDKVVRRKTKKPNKPAPAPADGGTQQATECKDATQVATLQLTPLPAAQENTALLSLDERDEAVLALTNKPINEATAADEVVECIRVVGEEIDADASAKQALEASRRDDQTIKECDQLIAQTEAAREIASQSLAKNRETFRQFATRNLRVYAHLARWHQIVQHVKKTNHALYVTLPTITGWAKDHNFPTSSVLNVVNEMVAEMREARKRLEAKIVQHQEAKLGPQEASKQKQEEEDLPVVPPAPVKREKQPAVEAEVHVNVIDTTKPHLRLDRNGVVYIVRDGKEIAVQTVEDFYVAVEMLSSTGKHLFNTCFGNLADEDLARKCVRLAEYVYLNHNNGKKRYSFHSESVKEDA